MKVKNILGTTLIVSCIAIVAKVIGFGREAIIAATFGATAATDAYFLAQSMPAMVFPAVCSSISTAFLVIYVDKRIKSGEEFATRFASEALVATLFVALVLSIIGFAIMPLVVPIFAPGFNESTSRLTILLSRITMGSFIFTMLQYMLTSILNARRFFYGPQVAGVLCSIFIITVTLLFGKNQTVEFLTWIVVGGLIIQICFLLLMTVAKAGFTFKIGPIANNEIWGMLRLAVPILLGNSVVQANTIVDKVLASGLTIGAVSALSYSNSLNSIVTSVFIVSLSTVLYPALVESASKEDNSSFANNLMQNLQMLFIIIAPISLITAIYSSDVVTIVFQRGSFQSTATDLTSNALTYYALGYAFIGIREIVIRGFYAIGDSKTPMYNGVLSVGLNIILSVILVSFMGIGGIALASTIAAVISACAIIVSMTKKMPHISMRMILPTFLKVMMAASVTFIFLHQFSGSTTVTVPLIRFVSGTVAGFVVYGIILALLDWRRAQYLIKMCISRVGHFNS